MFFYNERHAQSNKHSGDRKEPTLVDNEVRSAVALEFLRMDHQHARIREETLAPSGPVSTRTKAIKDQSFS